MAAASRPHRLRRWILIILAVLVLLPAAAIAIFVATFDAEAQKPRIAAAVERATGRRLSLAGPIGLKFSLVPTLVLQDVALANAPGGSRPEMLTLSRAELEVALLPLLSRRVELQRLVLVEPDLLLETDAQGRPNWQFSPAGAAAPEPAPAPAPEPAAGTEGGGPGGFAIAVDALRVEQGKVTWRDGRTGASQLVEIRRLDGTAPGGEPTRATGTIAWRELVAEVTAETGPLADFGGAAPWPVRLAASAPGPMRVAVQGALRGAAAWEGQVSASAADLAALAPLLPDVPLPPLRQLEVSAQLAGEGGTLTRLADLSLRAGESDLNALRPGLRLGRLEASAPGLDQPLTLALEAMQGQLPVSLGGRLGPPSALLPGEGAAPRAPWPVALNGEAAGAKWRLEGAVAQPRALAGVDLRLGVEVANLATLSPLVGAPLPAVQDLSLATRISERTPGFAGGAHLKEFALTSRQADAAGELTVIVGERPGLAGQLASRRVDVDALMAAAATTPPPAGQAGAPPAPPAPPPAPRPRAADGRLIPDIPLPLDALRLFDADVTWTIAELAAGGAPWREARAVLKVDAGRARLDPLSVTTPGGPVTLRGAADITEDPPVVQIAFATPGLDPAPLMALGGMELPVAGRMQLQGDLRGRGDDLRAVAATLHGPLGLAMVDGRLDRSLLASLPPELLRVLLPGGVPQAGVPMRCLAVRAEATDGVARTSTLLAETALGRIGGGGTVNLKDESLAMRLLPDLRVANLAVRAPVDIAGSLARPRIGVDPQAAAAAGIGAFLSQQATPDRTLQGLAEALGSPGGGGAAGGAAPALPDCATALAEARGGQAGPQPSTPAAAVPQGGDPAPQAGQAPPAVPGLPRDVPAPAQEMLRGLLGR